MSTPMADPSKNPQLAAQLDPGAGASNRAPTNQATPPSVVQ